VKRLIETSYPAYIGIKGLILQIIHHNWQALGPLVSNVSYCGCRPGEGVCGPYGQGPISQGGQTVRYGGNPSLTLGSDNKLLTGGAPCLFVGPKSSRCLPAVLMKEGTAKTSILSQMQIAGSSLVEYYGPLVQAGQALADSYYMTSNPRYTFYNKRFRTPLAERDSSFNVLSDDEDVLTFTAMDMGNSGGTQRRCMLCPQVSLYITNIYVYTYIYI